MKYLVPLSPDSQKFQITLAGKEYVFSLKYVDTQAFNNDAPLTITSNEASPVVNFFQPNINPKKLKISLSPEAQRFGIKLGKKKYIFSLKFNESSIIAPIIPEISNINRLIASNLTQINRITQVQPIQLEASIGGDILNNAISSGAIFMTDCPSKEIAPVATDIQLLPDPPTILIGDTIWPDYYPGYTVTFGSEMHQFIVGESSGQWILSSSRSILVDGSYLGDSENRVYDGGNVAIIAERDYYYPDVDAEALQRPLSGYVQLGEDGSISAGGSGAPGLQAAVGTANINFVSTSPYSVPAYVQQAKGSGVYVYYNQGSHFLRFPDFISAQISETSLYPFVVSYDGETIVGFGTSDILKSTDHGQTFSSVRSPSFSANDSLHGSESLQFLVSVARTIAFDGAPIRYSSDYGANWVDVSGCLDDHFIDCFISRDGTKLLAYTATTIWYSTDSGGHWSNVSFTALSGHNTNVVEFAADGLSYIANTDNATNTYYLVSF